MPSSSGSANHAGPWTGPRCSPGTARADAAPGNTRAGEWQPVRRLRAVGFRVALDDTDPYRDCGSVAGRAPADRGRGRPVAGRLPGGVAGDRARARGVRPGAGRRADHTDPADGRPPDGPEVSSGGQARVRGCGRVAHRPRRADLALLLIQEFQHAKLGAILDLYDLYDRADDRLFPSPWGEGKDGRWAAAGRLRAPGGHGVLAGGPAACGRPRARGGQAPIPRSGSAGREAIETLLGSGALTPLGTRSSGRCGPFGRCRPVGPCGRG